MNKKKQQQLSPENYIRFRVRNLPSGSSYINDNWRESGFAMIIVTRDHINGNVTHCAYIIDLYCLGMRDSFWFFNQNPLDFKEYLNKQVQAQDLGIKVVETTYALVHNIIYGAIAYAEELGFSPHKSFELTKNILEEDDERVKLIDIEFGYKGKPLYVSRPDDTGEAKRVMAQLDKKIGRDNYYFIKEAEANDFFEKEEMVEYNSIDYHDPLIKKNLISQFLADAASPKKFLSKKLDKMAEVLANSEIIFFEYMVTAEKLKEAGETIIRLFDFNISDENFSDDFLFGNAAIRENPDEVRRQADRLLQMEADGKTAQGIDESNRLIRDYPDVLVFQYLYLRFLEMNTEKRISSTTYRYYADKYPGYLPFVYKYAIAKLMDNNQKVPISIGESLHLKNFYPGKTTFCRREVILYVQLLGHNFNLSGEFAMAETMNHYLEDHHPGIISEYDIFISKITMISKVIDWCDDWMKSQA